MCDWLVTVVTLFPFTKFKIGKKEKYRKELKYKNRKDLNIKEGMKRIKFTVFKSDSTCINSVVIK